MAADAQLYCEDITSIIKLKSMYSILKYTSTTLYKLNTVVTAYNFQKIVAVICYNIPQVQLLRK